MAKKVHWRQGIVVSRDGEPDKPAMKDISDRYLEKASLERDPDRKKRYQNQATIVAMLGRINERLVDMNTYRPGRRKGSTYERKDAPAYDFMNKAAAETGEQRPHTLARLAVEGGCVNLTPTETAAAAIKRLAAGWKRRIQKN